MPLPYRSPLDQSRIGQGGATYTASPSPLRPLAPAGSQDDEEQRRRLAAQQQPGAQPAGGQLRTVGGAQTQPAPTFAQLAQQGRARPAPPMPSAAQLPAMPQQDAQLDTRVRDSVMQALAMP